MNERYPTKLVVENIAGKAKLRKTKKASNLSSISQTTPGAIVTSLTGIDLAAWITWAIGEGLITTGAGADTHMMSTNLTSTANRTHTVGNANTWQIAGGTTELTGLFIDPNDFVRIGDLGTASHGLISLGETEGGVKIIAYDTYTVTIGDANGDANGTTILINDDNQDIILTSTSISNNVNNFYVTANSGDLDILNPASIIRLGDPDANGNNIYVNIDDANEEIVINGETTVILGGLGVTSTPGLILNNDVAATVGAQQVSPGLRWSGSGWKTDATAGAQNVSFLADVLPVQGSASPTGTWQLKSSINGGTYGIVLSTTTAGVMTLRGDTSGNGTLDFTNVGANQAVLRRNSQTFLSSGWGGSNGTLLGSAGGFSLYVDGVTGVNIGVGVGGSSALAILNLTGITQTSASAAGIINGVQTWNTTGAPTALKINVTNTASDPASNLMDLQIATVSKFKVHKSGAVVFAPMTAATAAALTPGEGMVVMVSDTDGTFTSIGLWGYQNGAWAKV